MRLSHSEIMSFEKLQVITSYCKYADKRGDFEGIVNNGSWQEINIVHTHASFVRGGHFHRRTTEVIFMVTGRAEVQLAPCADDSQCLKLTLGPGQGLQIPPLISHKFLYLEDSSHIQLLDLRFNPDDQDLFTT